MKFADITKWITDNWDQICDIFEKLFEILVEKVG